MTPMLQRHVSAQRPGRPAARQRPPGIPDAAVAALGKLSETLEAVEHARGLLYGFHPPVRDGRPHLQEAVGMFRDAGYAGLADDIEETLVGRDLANDQWNFQLVGAYDAGYWQVFRDVEQQARASVSVPDRHVYEAEMKQREQGGSA